MPYKLSHRVCFQTTDLQEAKAHFQKELGLVLVHESPESLELDGGELRLFIDKGPNMGPIMELVVPELEKAKEDLIQQGWEVVVWEGKDQRCYVRNLMGTIFNLHEDPSLFDSEELEAN